MNKDTRKYNYSDYNVICDICGNKRKRSECVLAYGSGDLAVVMSCLQGGCADYRHPVNSPPPVIFDGRPVPDARPDRVTTSVTITSTQFIDQTTDIFINPDIGGSLYNWSTFPLDNRNIWGNLGDTNNQFTLNPYLYWGSF